MGSQVAFDISVQEIERNKTKRAMIFNFIYPFIKHLFFFSFYHIIHSKNLLFLFSIRYILSINKLFSAREYFSK